MSYASEWLLEIGAHNGSAVVTLRFSSGGYVTGPGDTPANTVYDARIVSAGTFTRHLMGDGHTIGEMNVEMSEVVLANADGGLDGVLSYGFDGRPLVLKRLASKFAAYGTAETVLTGTMEGVDTSNGMLNVMVRLYDRRRDIDVQLQKKVYGGTSTSAGATADGSPDMKGQIVPVLFGRNFSVPVTVVNPQNYIVQINDGAVTSIALYDGGIPLINDGDVADLATLASPSTTGNPGHYRTCLALGLARIFSGKPTYTWTADVVEGSTAASRSAASVVQRILAKIGMTGSSNLDTASFAALTALQPAEVGIYIDDNKSAMAACKAVLDSIGGYIIPNAQGQFTVGRIAFGTPVVTVTEPEIITNSKDDTIAFTANPDTDGDLAPRKVTLNWRKNWHVHTDSDTGKCVTVGSPDRASILQQEYQTVFAEVAQVKHLLAPELVLDTLLVDRTLAQNEVNRRLSLYGTDRVTAKISLARSDAASMLPGTTISVRLSRYGYAAGKTFLVIGRSDDYDNERAILTVWG